MRLTTLLLVSIFVMTATAVYANGMAPETETTTPTTPPTEETVTPPTGAGPTPPTGVMPAMVPEVDAFNTNFVTMSFGVDRAAVMGLRLAGWGWGDIYLLANIANRMNRPILEIASLRSQGLSYSDIASRYCLTVADITTPTIVQTRVAGFVTEYGYQPIYYRTDPWGNPVLTRYDAERLSRLGYDWRSIAMAANVAAVTGANVRGVLAWVDRGYTWPQIAREYGLNPKNVMDVSMYPFAREPGVMMAPVTPPITPPAGAGPMEPVCPPGTTTTQPVTPSTY